MLLFPIGQLQPEVGNLRSTRLQLTLQLLVLCLLRLELALQLVHPHLTLFAGSSRLVGCGTMASFELFDLGLKVACVLCPLTQRGGELGHPLLPLGEFLLEILQLASLPWCTSRSRTGLLWSIIG